MDIEGDEFPALTTLMDEYTGKELPIGQLLVEIHHFGENRTVQEFAQWWARLESFGMRPTWQESNLMTVTWQTGYPCCAEVCRPTTYMSSFSLIFISTSGSTPKTAKVFCGYNRSSMPMLAKLSV
ncbi:hypothetical protein F4777DRAFT_535349 [Nemania sp. FL0916]|nr:hypothetical protein F4777DRAFT_535349 [Nemania sp. FL0916]